MNAMQIFSSPSIQALGWTLLHSIWQGLICTGICLLVLRCIPGKWSGARYVAATSALVLIFFLSVSTFIYLISSNEQITPDAISLVHFTKSVEPVQTESNYLAGLLSGITLTLQDYLPMIVICWGVGTILFTIRLLGGWVTVRRLKTSAIVVEGEWNERMQQLVHKLDINQFIQLAESATVQAPLVIGYFKPVVLIPLGMIGGLSTEQLESIIIHELIHIRRHDYLVNLLQSLLEAMLFFNPFVWIISNIIRREREHCCDDAVIALHGNRLAYAHALTALEEARLSRAGLALSLAEDKNQLLNRIKRIMEKSVKPYSLRQRIVPVILVITGLICASWLTINSAGSEREQEKPVIADNVTVSSDTTIKIEKSGRYYRKSITTIGEDGKPHEEVVEEFDGDEDLPAPMDFDLALPAIDAIEAIEVMPPVDMLSAMPAVSYVEPMFISFQQLVPLRMDFDMSIQLDTVPYLHRPDFTGFVRDYEAFRQRSGCGVKVESDSFEQLEKEIEQMTKDLEVRFDDHTMEELAHQMQLLSAEDQIRQSEEILAQQAEQMKNFEEQMGRWEKENARQLAEFDHQFKTMSIPSFDFVKDLRPDLVKDGYLKEDEEIKSIEINDEVIKVNGKTIKESDQKKYRDIIKKNSYGPKLPPRSGRLE